MGLLLCLAVAAAGIGSSLAILWFHFPHLIVRGFFRFLAYRAGLRRRFVKAGPYRYCYAEKGVPSKGKTSVIFIHGFSASKDMWIEIARRLPEDTHIIVPDLPGHGETTIPKEGDPITWPDIADQLHQFLCVIGQDRQPFHMVGGSMGGAIAAIFASKYPHMVHCLSLMCPAVQTPVENEFLREVRAGHCRLIPDTPEQLQKMLDSCFYHKMKFNKQFLKGSLMLRLPKNEYLRRLFEEVHKELDGTLMEDVVAKVTAPTQLVWGEDDELVHISGLEYLKKMLPNCVSTNVIKECGHSMNVDHPGYVVKHINNFRKDYGNL